MAFWLNDLSAMLNDFGVTASGRFGAFRAIFDAKYVGVGDVEVESFGPALTCRSADVEELAHGDALEVDGSQYVVRGIEPDGTGVTVLRLEAS